MNLELNIAWQYIKSHHRQKNISLIAKISILGLILSIMSLITVLSVMNGFQAELKNRILGAISHAYISNYVGSIPQQNPLIPQLKQHKNIIGISPYIENYALLTHGNNASGAIVRGIHPEQETLTSNLLSSIKYGSANLVSDNQIIIGLALANTLGVGIGDKINVLTPKIGVNILGIAPRFKRFNVSGIFDTGEAEYNKNLVLITLISAQKLYQKQGQISGLRLKFDQVLKADVISADIAKELDEKYYIINWKQQQQNLIYALNLEKNMIRLILFFIIAIATFNLVSTMIMVVIDKQSDIAILRTLGLTPRRILTIFFYQSFIISSVGISIGVILGIIVSLFISDIVSFVEYIFSFQLLPATVFYVNKLPSELLASDVLFAVVLALLLSMISAYYPAVKAAKTDIAKTLNDK